MKLQEVMNYISITVITFLIGYLLSHAIIRTVDERLTDISINMPRIVLPKHLFKKEISEFGPTDYKLVSEQVGGGRSRNCVKSISPRTKFDTDIFKSDTHSAKKIQQIEKIEAARSTINFQSATDKQEEVSYYLDPIKMSKAQLLKYKQFAKPSKMTLTDYKKWLTLYSNDPHNLERSHRDKLRILLKGGELTHDDLPEPQSSSDWWKDKFDNIPAPEVPGNRKAHNYDDYQYYEDPKNLKHLTYINPDELIKHSDRVLDEINGRATKTRTR